MCTVSLKTPERREKKRIKGTWLTLNRHNMQTRLLEN